MFKRSPHRKTTILGKVDAKAPGIVARMPFTQSLNTGIRIIDTVTPISRGMSTTVMGEGGTGKTSIALTAIINQVSSNDRVLSKNGVVSIYVSIGQRPSSVARIYELLKHHGALKSTTIVAATSADSAGFQYLAPFSGATLGEYFRNRGQNALVVYDDLSKHAAAYRSISQLFHRENGSPMCFPLGHRSSLFHLHAKLTERSAKMSPRNGEGSLTSLAVVDIQPGKDIRKENEVASNMLRMTDVQLFTEQELFDRGQRPAISLPHWRDIPRAHFLGRQKSSLGPVSRWSRMILREYLRDCEKRSEHKSGHVQLRAKQILELFKQPEYTLLPSSALASSAHSLLDTWLPLVACREGLLDDLELRHVALYARTLFHKEEENDPPQKKTDIGQSRTARAAAKNLHEISTMLLFVPLNNSSGWQMRSMPQVGREVYQKLEAHSKTVRSSSTE